MPINIEEDKKDNSENQEIIDLLKANLELNEKMYKMMIKVDSFVFWQNILGWGKVVLVVVPIVVAFIFLPPFLKNAFEQYKDLLGLGAVSGLDISALSTAKEQTGGKSFTDSDFYLAEAKRYACSDQEMPYQACFCNCLKEAKTRQDYDKCLDKNKCDSKN